MPSRKTSLHMYADECIPVPTITALRKKGISIVHAFDFGYVNKSDILHFKKSKLENRILLSLDKDFRKFKKVSTSDHPGIILITTGNNTFVHINKILNKSLKYISANYVKHSILRVTIDKIAKEKDGIISEKKI